MAKKKSSPLAVGCLALIIGIGVISYLPNMSGMFASSEEKAAAQRAEEMRVKAVVKEMEQKAKRDRQRKAQAKKDAAQAEADAKAEAERLKTRYTVEWYVNRYKKDLEIMSDKLTDEQKKTEAYNIMQGQFASDMKTRIRKEPARAGAIDQEMRQTYKAYTEQLAIKYDPPF